MVTDINGSPDNLAKPPEAHVAMTGVTTYKRSQRQQTTFAAHGGPTMMRA